MLLKRGQAFESGGFKEPQNNCEVSFQLLKSKLLKTYFHWKILSLAGIWTQNLPGIKPICYQLSYPGLDNIEHTSIPSHSSRKHWLLPVSFHNIYIFCMMFGQIFVQFTDQKIHTSKLLYIQNKIRNELTLTCFVAMRALIDKFFIVILQ